MLHLKKIYLPSLAVALLHLIACNNQSTSSSTTDSSTASSSDSLKSNTVMIPDKKNFETTIDGKKTDLFILKNQSGITAAITNYGGRVVSLMVPDKSGKMTDVVVGFSDLDGYKKGANAYYGALIGRYGNRIGNGSFKLDGTTYTLYKNNGPNTLHGGKKGFDSEVWDAKQVNDSTLELTYLSRDMEEGFPGNLHVKVTYNLTNDNGLRIEYEATTDKKTVLNLTNHSYFNLNGVGSGTILNHLVQIYADKFTPVDSTLIPTGQLQPVAGTPFDFTKPTAIGARINDNNPQLVNGKGYDHNFVLNGARAENMNHAATVTADKSGIVMNVYTTEPGMQFYTGNFMEGANTLINGAKDDKRTAFCMETQHFPDSPNKPSFPSTTLNPGQAYHSVTKYQFSK
jgi:aldose 1-epimerase